MYFNNLSMSYNFYLKNVLFAFFNEQKEKYRQSVIILIFKL